MLMGTKPVYNSGMEQEEFEAYATDSFQELLDTSPIVDTVILYNYDLSESKELQCVIQNNTADTLLKTMDRQILCSIGILKAGMYIFYHNNYWLVTGRPDNNKIYEKSTLSICQYKLLWQNSSGEIIERWCNITSSSKYGNGETGSNTIILTDDGLTLLLPNDDESLILGDREESNHRRVFIDKQTIPKKVYKITREDDVLYDYGESGGILSFIAKKTELNQERDNQELRICDYITPPLTPPIPPSPDENPDKTTVFCEITYKGKKIINAGGNAKALTAKFTDESRNTISDVAFTWSVSIIDEFLEFLHTETLEDKTLKLWLDYDDLLAGNYVKVFVHDLDGTELASETFEIGGVL